MSTKHRAIWLDFDLPVSLAFRSLTATSHVVLMLFYRRRRMSSVKTKDGKRHVCANNGEIVFTYDEAQDKYLIPRKTFAEAIDQLVDRGFIDIAQPGIGQHGCPTLYAISERWRLYGTERFVPVQREKRCVHRFAIGNKKGRVDGIL